MRNHCGYAGYIDSCQAHQNAVPRLWIRIGESDMGRIVRCLFNNSNALNLVTSQKVLHCLFLANVRHLRVDRLVRFTVD